MKNGKIAMSIKPAMFVVMEKDHQMPLTPSDVAESASPIGRRNIMKLVMTIEGIKD